MKGLIYKDCVTLLHQMKFYLLLIAAFSLFPNYTISGFALVYASALPFSAIAYDEQSKWNRLAIMMPYTDGQLVLSKYLLGWASVLGVALLSVAGYIANCLVRGAQAELGNFSQSILITMAGALILLAVVLPLLFRFGAERGRMMFMLLIVAGAIAVSLTGSLMVEDLDEGAAQAVLCIAAILAVAANALSVRLSRKFFRRGLRA